MRDEGYVQRCLHIFVIFFPGSIERLWRSVGVSLLLQVVRKSPPAPIEC